VLTRNIFAGYRRGKRQNKFSTNNRNNYPSKYVRISFLISFLNIKKFKMIKLGLFQIIFASTHFCQLLKSTFHLKRNFYRAKTDSNWLLRKMVKHETKLSFSSLKNFFSEFNTQHTEIKNFLGGEKPSFLPTWSPHQVLIFTNIFLMKKPTIYLNPF